jgi:hypothetical protein
VFERDSTVVAVDSAGSRDPRVVADVDARQDVGGRVIACPRVFGSKFVLACVQWKAELIRPLEPTIISWGVFWPLHRRPDAELL